MIFIQRILLTITTFIAIHGLAYSYELKIPKEAYKNVQYTGVSYFPGLVYKSLDQNAFKKIQLEIARKLEITLLPPVAYFIPVISPAEYYGSYQTGEIGLVRTHSLDRLNDQHQNEITHSSFKIECVSVEYFNGNFSFYLNINSHSLKDVREKMKQSHEFYLSRRGHFETNPYYPKIYLGSVKKLVNKIDVKNHDGEYACINDLRVIHN